MAHTDGAGAVLLGVPHLEHGFIQGHRGDDTGPAQAALALCPHLGQPEVIVSATALILNALLLLQRPHIMLVSPRILPNRMQMYR